jgi:hypothetical protein
MTAAYHEGGEFKPGPGYLTGGAGRSRTALDGFAIHCITALLPRQCTQEKGKPQASLLPALPEKATMLLFKYGAGKESRTLDLNLGKVALSQLSYSRISSFEL